MIILLYLQLKKKDGVGSTFIGGYQDAKTYGDSQDYDRVKQDYSAIAQTLKSAGINMNLAPVAEVADESSIIGRRSFGTDYNIVSNCVISAIDGMKEQNLMTSLKYFPGYAYSEENSDGIAVDSRTTEELQTGLNVFQNGIKEDVATVTMANVIVEAIDDENLATLSSDVISSVRDMGFTGVIMTDNLDDNTKSQITTIEDRYVQAIIAGNDVIVVNDFDKAKQQILNAYRNGTITEKTIDRAVKNILTMKFEYGVIDPESVQIEEDDIEVTETADNFQGAIHLRRVMPDKEPGSMTNVSTGTPVEKYTYVTASNDGLGTKEDIPENVKEEMDGISMNGISGTSYDDLSYLTIPYYDANGKEKSGRIIVNKELADEVLLIFQELYNIQYPLENMEPIEEYKGRMDEAGIDENNDSIDYATKLENTSKYFNNTYSFNDKKDSSHGTGCAIDLNPLVNPYVDGDNVIPSNAEKYTNRNLMAGWSDSDKKQKIDADSEVVKIFEKYGWTWSGNSEGAKDYGHFEKTDLSNVTKISTIINASGQVVEDNSSDISNGTTTSTAKYTIVVDAGHGDPSKAGGYGDLAENQADLDAGKLWYTTGTSGTTPSGETWTERETVQKIVDYVIELSKNYPNIEVIQTGKDQPNCKRIELAKNAGADAYIGIHLNSGGGSGTLTMIREGQGENETYKFAEICLNTVSEALGLQKNQVLADDAHTKTGLDTYDECGIPAIYIEGGFMDSQTDMAVIGAENDEGLKKYAQGVINGILQYFGLEGNASGNTGTTTNTGNSTVNAGIRSRVFDLRYVSKEKFDKDVEENNQEALKEFTMDDEGKIMIASWSYNSGDGGLKLTSKTFQTGKSYTQKYTMPMEYLIAYYIDTENKEFISDLADLAIDSEFVLAIQDNVTVTKTDITNLQEVITTTTDRHTNEETRTTNTTTTGSSSTIIETVSTNLELTYGDTWFVKFYKDVSYSSTDLSSLVASNGSNLTGEQGEYIGDFKITAYCSACNSPPGSLETASGVDATVNNTIAVHKDYFDGSAVGGRLKEGSQVIINGQVYTVQDTGDTSRRQPDNWIDIFVETSNGECACNYSSVNSDSTPVYVAKNVTEASQDTSASEVADNNNRVDTIAIIKGHVDLTNNSITERQPSTNDYDFTEDETIHKVITNIVITNTEQNKYSYSTGEMHITGNEQKFITICRKNRRFQERLKPEWLFRVLEQQDETINMLDLTKYLLYRATNQNGDFGVTSFDFNQYAPQDFNEVSSSGGGLSLSETMFTKEVFTQALQAYYDKTGNQAFYNNFLSKVDELYDTAVACGVNPELVVITAKTEGNFREAGGSYNYWGLNVPNGESSGDSFSSLAEGVRGYAQYIQKYETGSFAEEITKRYEERKAAGCDPLGYGLPGTLSGMQSLYSYLGKHGYAYSGAGSGGYYYMDPEIAGVTKIYATHEEFVEKCLNGGPEHADGTETTVWEQGQYTAWQVEKKLDVWEDIFGDYGSLSSAAGNGDIVQNAIEVHKYVREQGFEYAQAGIYVPAENGSTIDCSSYVTWVLVNAGIEGFTEGMYQWSSSSFMSNPYGWEEISKESVQPGDILVYSGHVEIYAGTDDYGNTLVYNCGGDDSIGATGTNGLEEASGASGSHGVNNAAKILRVPTN